MGGRDVKDLSVMTLCDHGSEKVGMEMQTQLLHLYTSVFSTIFSVCLL